MLQQYIEMVVTLVAVVGTTTLTQSLLVVLLCEVRELFCLHINCTKQKFLESILVLLVVSVIIGAVIGAADNDTLLINGKAFAAAENKTDYLLTDISMISIIIMMVATIIALIVSMAIQPKK